MASVKRYTSEDYDLVCEFVKRASGIETVNEEITIQSLTHLDETVCFHGLPLQDAIYVLLWYANPAPQLGFGQPKFDTPFLDFCTHMHVLDAYFHRFQSLNRD